MTRVASHQPVFLPWPGFWHKVASVDHFVISAGVKWKKDGFINRVRHDAAWLTVPVRTSDEMPIWHVEVAPDQRTLMKTAKTIEQVMRTKANRYASRVEPIHQAIMKASPGDRLTLLNMDLLGIVKGLLQLKTRLTLDIQTEEVATTTVERLRDRMLRNEPDMTHYFLGSGAAAAYFNARKFYPTSCWVQDASRFEPSLSIVQLLAQESDPLDYIMSRGRWQPLKVAA